MEKLHVHRCEKCPKVFPNTSDLIKYKSFHDKLFLSHLTSAYVLVERAKIFKCDKCTQSFDDNKEFIVHKVAHARQTVLNERKSNKLQNPNIVKSFKCPDCNVSYATQSALDGHYILHLPFPYTCQCGIGYYGKEDLKGHIKMVHGIIIQEDILSPNEEKVKRQEKPHVITPSKVISKSKKSPTVKEAVKKKKPKQKKSKVDFKSEDTTSNRPKPFPLG